MKKRPNDTVSSLENLCAEHTKFLGKGGLCVALVLTRRAKVHGLPIDKNQIRTPEQGQVSGLGKAAVQAILSSHGITKILAQEGGRTSRGALGLAETYVGLMNALADSFDAEAAEAWWILRVKNFFASEGPVFRFDDGISLRDNIFGLLNQAAELQKLGSGTAYLGQMLQHLVGAKLEITLGKGKIKHHNASTADSPTNRSGDFAIGDVAIHVTIAPTIALVEKCAANLQSGLRPIIITLGAGHDEAMILLKTKSIENRVDVLEVVQFLTTNVYEHSLFLNADCRPTLKAILIKYNEMIALHETDPSLTIRF